MASAQGDTPGRGDAELITDVRNGSTEAYGQLYERHVAAAYNLARQLARSNAEADDLVSEAFAKVLDTLRAGRGPDAAFRAYLLTALRHTAYDKTRRDRKVEFSDDISGVADAAAAVVPFTDTAVAGLDRSLAAKAFARLPERWQAVLWHTEIEGQSPAEVAPILGLTPNGVSALAYRAREGLRQAYLQVHVGAGTEEHCRATIERLGAWTRDGLSRRETAQVEAHLDSCDRCRVLAAELGEVNGALRLVIAPLVLGGAVTAYLAAAGAGSAKAAAAGLAAAGAAAGAGAGSGGGVGGAASALPRQVVGSAVSAVALGAAIAVGMTADQGQEPPKIAAQQTTRQVVPPPPEPEPPQPPSPPPAQPTPPPPPPPTTPPPTTPPPVPPPPPEPQPARLVPSVSAPQGPLVPGGPPQEMGITVANNGEKPSDPVTVKLNLPPGVTVGKPAPRFAPMGSRAIIECASATCTSPGGIAPGDSATFRFKLYAAPDAKPGTITGTINAGALPNVSIPTVPVEVKPVDAIDLSARVRYIGRWPARLDIVATNRGSQRGKMHVEIVVPKGFVGIGWPAPCTGQGTTLHCEKVVNPGSQYTVQLWLLSVGADKGTVQLRARLGSATKSLAVPVDLPEHEVGIPGLSPNINSVPPVPGGLRVPGDPAPSPAPHPTTTPSSTSPPRTTPTTPTTTSGG
ncbi:sigma-70 family RNA polymerase sigma factor [Allokutzneria albata]|uniref:RNA polymerase sigma factor, sigma-70 family n=1 Tax=Allokutzneria albata TaxID=211114 RepID=A0A1H0BCK3_ALLAB|nr:sigma-70 family RNA polymerase sigma factor [Allokutzneria albata]SDN43359.1 RNA polymerase sigma factor, sigma-70 family [Allokutzneria albata]